MGGFGGRDGALWHDPVVRAVALLALVVALLTGCGGDDSSSVVVPYVVGLSEPNAIQATEEAGLPEVGVMVDLWHVGDTPDVERHLAENVDRITGVHVAEHFPGGRSDRDLPGERCAELMRVLRDAGWSGAWDVEIFGDAEQPDSLWSLDVDEAARRAYAAAARAAGR